MLYPAFFSPASRVTSRSTRLIGLGTLLCLLLVLSALAPGSSDAASKSLIAPASSCPNLPASGGKKAMAQARRSMVCMVNYARRKQDLKPYRRHRKLGWSASHKASDILRCGFSHTACGRQFDYWIRKSGYLGRGGWSTGENIAWGSGYLGNVRSIFVAWMKSTGHREAILSQDFTDIGVGVVKGTFEQFSGARIWVLHFGDN